MAFFKKKKKKEQLEYLDPDLDIEAEFRKRKERIKARQTDEAFEKIETLQYVRTQCQLIAESGNYVNELKTEYDVVNSYLTDVRVIESQDKVVSSKLRAIATQIVTLENKRERMRKEPSKLKHGQYAMLELYEEDFPQRITEFQNEEKYADAVKHDINALEAEKTSLKEDIDNYQSRRNNVRNISIISLLGILAVFIIFVISGTMRTKNGMTLFMIVLLLCAVFLLLITVVLNRMETKFKVSEKKLARAITLQNKTKIKYVNVKNSVDYRKEKYGVKNAYELSRVYELYLMEKKKMETYKTSAVELDDAYVHLSEEIAKLNLYDGSVWSAQLEALMDDKAMRNLKNSLNLRRQNLRDRIDYNMSRMEDAKSAITNILKKHPELSKDIVEMVDSYDQD